MLTIHDLEAGKYYWVRSTKADRDFGFVVGEWQLVAASKSVSGCNLYFPGSELPIFADDHLIPYLEFVEAVPPEGVNA